MFRPCPIHLYALMLATSLAACSSPPKPPVAEGQVTPANDAAALNELVRTAVAAQSSRSLALRYRAERGERLKTVLIRWTQMDRTQLAYRSEFDPVLIGAVDESDLKAAAVALSVLLQHEQSGAVLDFTKPGVLVVKNFLEERR